MSVNPKASAAQKKAAKKRPQTFKPGNNMNPHGAPRRGQSWAESIKRLGDLLPEEAERLAAQNSLTLRDMAILASLKKQIFDPDGRMFAALADRAEGKPNQSIDLNAQVQSTVDIGVRLVDYRSGIAEAPARPALDSPAPGEVEMADGRPQVGEDRTRRSADVEHAETTR